MKKFLNQITEEEKNRILEMHSSKKEKLINENFVNLLNSKLGNIKPLVNEDAFTPFIGKLSRSSRKFAAQNEDDIIKAFNTTETALAKQIDDFVSAAVKSKSISDIQTLEAKIIAAIDPSSTNIAAAQEQTKKILNAFSKSRGKKNWAQIKSEVESGTATASKTTANTSSKTAAGTTKATTTALIVPQKAEIILTKNFGLSPKTYINLNNKMVKYIDQVPTLPNLLKQKDVPSTWSKIKSHFKNQYGYYALGLLLLISLFPNSTEQEIVNVIGDDSAKITGDDANAEIPNPKPTVGWDNYPCVTTHPNAKSKKLSDGSLQYTIGNFVYYSNGRKMNSTTYQISSYNCETEFKQQTQVKQTPCPVGGGTTEEVKVFQDWLDSNAKGWLPKYPDGLNKDVKKGYGMCGPNTRKAWSQYGEQYKTTPEQNDTVSSNAFTPQQGEDDVVIPDNTTAQGVTNPNQTPIRGTGRGSGLSSMEFDQFDQFNQP